MPILYRRAEPQDLVAAESLVVASINELTERHGFGLMATSSPPNFQQFSLKDDPDGLWIAEELGDILGFAWSWACSDFWFLAQLFVEPGQQGRGIGNELLKLTLEHAQKSKAVHKALITFTFNRVSQGLYIRHGFYPKAPVYFLGIARDHLRPSLPESPLRSTAIDGSDAQLKRLAEIDSISLGFTREKHHRYLRNDPDTSGVMLYSSSECVGYAYVNSSGHIGPLAVTRPDVLGHAFTSTLKLAAERQSKNISAFVPGTCDSALGIAVKFGMRITFPMLLMATSGYPSWTGYLPRNPGFM
ncbi:MAG: GNAT family N-acetyltransferase [Proteobacteria bacterium]|nr:GNAT family N-acetyltransferase [Pseudomonadota bacterium]